MSTGDRPLRACQTAMYDAPQSWPNKVRRGPLPKSKIGHHYEPSPTPATRLAGVFLFGAKGGPGGAKKGPGAWQQTGAERGGWGLWGA